MQMIVLPGLPAARLGEAAVDHLFAADRDEGCCPRCCGTCWALAQLVAGGMLDDLVRVSPGTAGSEWWTGDQVDPEFLARAWRLTSCHEGDQVGPDQENPPTRYRTVEVVDGWAVTAPADVDDDTARMVAEETRSVVEYLTSP